MRCQGFDTGLGTIFILNVECREKGFQILEESECITIQNDTTSTGIWLLLGRSNKKSSIAPVEQGASELGC